MGNGKDFWGSKQWKYLHVITFANGNKVSVRPKLQTHISSLQNLLPCMECRQNFSKKLVAFPVSKFNGNFFNMIYIYHDQVNKYYNKKNPNLVQKISPPLQSVYNYYSSIAQDRNLWERDMWISFYCIAASYSPEFYQSAIDFFKTVQYVLPTEETRNLFSHLVEQYPIEPYLNSNHDLFFWVYLINDAYCKKLGCVIDSDYTLWKSFIFKSLGDDCKQCQ